MPGLKAGIDDSPGTLRLYGAGGAPDPPPTSFLLLEDGVSILLLEDGVSFLGLETGNG